MSEFKEFFQYIVIAGGGVIAYFFKNILTGVKQQEVKIDLMEKELAKFEGKIYLIDSQTSSKIEKLEELSKVQFEQLHTEIGDLKAHINEMNTSIRELIKAK